MGSVKQLAKRSKWLVCAASVVDDQRSRLAARRGAPPSTSGSTHSAFDLDESLDYIDSVYSDYLRVGGIKEADLAGASVLELGPGDNFGVALRFLAAGAGRVIAVDKFHSRRDPAQQRRIYAALLDGRDAESRSRMESAIDLETLRFDPARLGVIEGVAVEEAADALDGDRFDLVVSRAVLEHLYDLGAAFASMDALLRPGGTMVHKVDFRDHGMFTGGGMHQLTFLTVPAPVYQLMSRNSGRPNRKLGGWYRAKLDALGYRHRVLVTHVVGRRQELSPYVDIAQFSAAEHPESTELVSAIRPRLRAEYARLDDEDLVTDGIFLAAEKPAGRAGAPDRPDALVGPR